MRPQLIPRYLFLTVFLPVLLTLSLASIAQSPPVSGAAGGLKGNVWDSVSNHALQDATVAVYLAADSSLVQFRITDVYGGFNFDKLPMDKPLYLVVSFAGLELLARSVRLQYAGKPTVLGRLAVGKVQVLREFTVSTIVPVRVNRDTIEFNARAFRLDSNAVVEDLIRQLPGMTVWGDGSITLNGREVKGLTVNGKPFLGQSFKVATRNIPKNAVDKIQVFNQVNTEDPLDTLTRMNIKLMSGKNLGYFGKVSAGAGTDERFQGEGIISFFNSRNQLSIGAITNNVNKLAEDMNTLQEHTTFKGTTATVEYQPDFHREGVSKSYSGGLFYKHNFSDRVDYNHNNALKFDYFGRYQQMDAIKQTNTLIFLNSNDQLQQERNRRTAIVSEKHDVSGDYNFLESSRELTIVPFVIRETTTTDVSVEENSSLNGLLQSRNSSHTFSDVKSQDYGVKVAFRNFNNYESLNKRSFRNFKISYVFTRSDDQDEQNVQSNFRSLTTSSVTNVNRKYRVADERNAHQLDFELEHLNRLLFGGRSLSDYTLKLVEKASLTDRKLVADVVDFDSAKMAYAANAYLTNQRQGIVFQNDLSLVLGRQLYNRNLSGRYRKLLSVHAELLGQYFQQRNNSDKLFQNINRSYFKPLPQAGLVFDHSKFSYIRRILSVQYTTTVTYPTIEQMAPLVDSARIWLIQMGNPGLMPAKDRRLKISFSKSMDLKQSYRYQVEVMAGDVKDMLADSTIYDASGRAGNYLVNVRGYRYAGGSATLKHTTRFRFHQFQTNVALAGRFTRTPGYVNTALLYTTGFFSNNLLSVTYTYKNNLALNLQQRLDLLQSTQQSASDRFRNTVYTTNLAVTGNLGKRLSVSTDGNYIVRAATGSRNNRFLLWNAHVTARLLKRNNLELKASAMDLLRQNSGLINESTPTSITTGVNSVLRQYFMMSVAYFPRKFGK